MKKVFLDTNVVLDLILEREYKHEVAQIFAMCEQSLIVLYVSFLTIANLAYIVRKSRSQQQLRTIIADLKLFVNVLPMTDEQLNFALQVDGKDFEDILQYECAKAFGCDVIVSRNKKDFSFSELQVLTPSEYLENA